MLQKEYPASKGRSNYFSYIPAFDYMPSLPSPLSYHPNPRAPDTPRDSKKKEEEITPGPLPRLTKMGDVTPEMERMFKRFDTNGDGKISSAELGEALRTLGSTSTDEIQRMMAELDTDGDGYIDFSEFSDFCRANPGLMKDVAKVF